MYSVEDLLISHGYKLARTCPAPPTTAAVATPPSSSSLATPPSSSSSAYVSTATTTCLDNSSKLQLQQRQQQQQHVINNNTIVVGRHGSSNNNNEPSRGAAGGGAYNGFGMEGAGPGAGVFPLNAMSGGNPGGVVSDGQGQGGGVGGMVVERPLVRRKEPAPPLPPPPPVLVGYLGDQPPLGDSLATDSGFYDAPSLTYSSAAVVVDHPEERDVSYWRRRGQDFSALLDFADPRELRASGGFWRGAGGAGAGGAVGGMSVDRPVARWEEMPTWHQREGAAVDSGPETLRSVVLSGGGGGGVVGAGGAAGGAGADRKWQSLGNDDWTPAVSLGWNAGVPDAEQRWTQEQHHQQQHQPQQLQFRLRPHEGAVVPVTRQKSQSLPRVLSPEEPHYADPPSTGPPALPVVPRLNGSGGGAAPYGRYVPPAVEWSTTVSAAQASVIGAGPGVGVGVGEWRAPGQGAQVPSHAASSSSAMTTTTAPSKPRFGRPVKPPSYETHQQSRGGSWETLTTTTTIPPSTTTTTMDQSGAAKHRDRNLNQNQVAALAAQAAQAAQAAAAIAAERLQACAAAAAAQQAASDLAVKERALCVSQTSGEPVRGDRFPHQASVERSLSVSQGFEAFRGDSRTTQACLSEAFHKDRSTFVSQSADPSKDWSLCLSPQASEQFHRDRSVFVSQSADLLPPRDRAVCLSQTSSEPLIRDVQSSSFCVPQTSEAFKERSGTVCLSHSSEPSSLRDWQLCVSQSSEALRDRALCLSQTSEPFRDRSQTSEPFLRDRSLCQISQISEPSSLRDRSLVCLSQASDAVPRDLRSVFCTPQTSELPLRYDQALCLSQMAAEPSSFRDPRSICASQSSEALLRDRSLCVSRISEPLRDRSLCVSQISEPLRDRSLCVSQISEPLRDRSLCLSQTSELLRDRSLCVSQASEPFSRERERALCQSQSSEPLLRSDRDRPLCLSQSSELLRDRSMCLSQTSELLRDRALQCVSQASEPFSRERALCLSRSAEPLRDLRGDPYHQYQAHHHRPGLFLSRSAEPLRDLCLSRSVEILRMDVRPDLLPPTPHDIYGPYGSGPAPPGYIPPPSYRRMGPRADLRWKREPVSAELGRWFSRQTPAITWTDRWEDQRSASASAVTRKSLHRQAPSLPPPLPPGRPSGPAVPPPPPPQYFQFDDPRNNNVAVAIRHAPPSSWLASSSAPHLPFEGGPGAAEKSSRHVAPKDFPSNHPASASTSAIVAPAPGQSSTHDLLVGAFKTTDGPPALPPPPPPHNKTAAPSQDNNASRWSRGGKATSGTSDDQQGVLSSSKFHSAMFSPPSARARSERQIPVEPPPKKRPDRPPDPPPPKRPPPPSSSERPPPAAEAPRRTDAGEKVAPIEAPPVPPPDPPSRETAPAPEKPKSMKRKLNETIFCLVSVPVLSGDGSRDQSDGEGDGDAVEEASPVRVPPPPPSTPSEKSNTLSSGPNQSLKSTSTTSTDLELQALTGAGSVSSSVSRMSRRPYRRRDSRPGKPNPHDALRRYSGAWPGDQYRDQETQTSPEPPSKGAPTTTTTTAGAGLAPPADGPAPEASGANSNAKDPATSSSTSFGYPMKGQKRLKPSSNSAFSRTRTFCKGGGSGHHKPPLHPPPHPPPPPPNHPPAQTTPTPPPLGEGGGGRGAQGSQFPQKPIARRPGEMAATVSSDDPDAIRKEDGKRPSVDQCIDDLNEAYKDILELGSAGNLGATSVRIPERLKARLGGGADAPPKAGSLRSGLDTWDSDYRKTDYREVKSAFSRPSTGKSVSFSKHLREEIGCGGGPLSSVSEPPSGFRDLAERQLGHCWVSSATASCRLPMDGRTVKLDFPPSSDESPPKDDSEEMPSAQPLPLPAAAEVPWGERQPMQDASTLTSPPDYEHICQSLRDPGVATATAGTEQEVVVVKPRLTTGGDGEMEIMETPPHQQGGDVALGDECSFCQAVEAERLRSEWTGGSVFVTAPMTTTTTMATSGGLPFHGSDGPSSSGSVPADWRARLSEAERHLETLVAESVAAGKSEESRKEPEDMEEQGASCRQHGSFEPEPELMTTDQRTLDQEDIEERGAFDPATGEQQEQAEAGQSTDLVLGGRVQSETDELNVTPKYPLSSSASMCRIINLDDPGDEGLDQDPSEDSILTGKVCPSLASSSNDPTQAEGLLASDVGQQGEGGPPSATPDSVLTRAQGSGPGFVPDPGGTGPAVDRDAKQQHRRSCEPCVASALASYPGLDPLLLQEFRPERLPLSLLARQRPEEEVSTPDDPGISARFSGGSCQEAPAFLSRRLSLDPEWERDIGGRGWGLDGSGGVARERRSLDGERGLEEPGENVQSEVSQATPRGGRGLAASDDIIASRCGQNALGRSDSRIVRDLYGGRFDDKKNKNDNECVGGNAEKEVARRTPDDDDKSVKGRDFVGTQ
ncbi:hypothetical protein ACEWY4_027478 [Coilia grayii]|uniref:Uncharacterized protein n=1 Tax=Coilia grayii TaxID=363190 RepID=A0ABD1IPH2_9TELE